ncbi:MAG: fructose-6-phosphate aldolase [candidate division KSB1 bacterium]|nr:fructose-6-phosphate aldolase [candidate division KSB1 bacterium]MDZ7346254.1 fructose-6-phosphate aldolase [candidate division KSB1 bacterium]
MQLFIDSANLDEIRKAVELGLCDGVTTNPTLLAKEKESPEEIYRTICEMVNGPVCAETIGQTKDEIITEGRKLKSIHENIVVKIPCTLDGLAAVRVLEQENIHTNVTLIFTPLQALLAAKAGATYVCPFVGRLDDAAHEGMELIRQILAIFENYGFLTQVIVASVRGVMHVLDSALAGAHVVTVPFAVLEKIVKHPLTDAGVAAFLKDWQKTKRRA